VDVSIDLFGRFQLHNEIHFWDVETSSCDVSSYQTFEFTFLKALECDLSLLLRNVSVENLCFLLEVSLQKDLVGLLLCFSEDDGSTMTPTIEVDNVRNDCVSMIVGAVEGQMFDGLGGSDFGIFDEVNELSVG